MEPKRSKYDTNPLDEDFADRATDSFSANEPASTAGVHGGPTRPMNSAESEAVRAYSESEAPTRHINDKVTSYPSVFVPPPPKPAATYQPPRNAAPAGIYQPPPTLPPNIYQSPPVPLQRPGSHTVAGIGIPERWAVLLPYLPFWLAIVASIIELVLVPRTESRVRFHASQGLVLQLAVTAISMLLTGAAYFSGRFSGAGLFNFATFVFFIIAMIRVWKGKPFVVTPVDEPRKWLDQKIGPRK
jgi:uncharacterized membrane protein